MTGVSPAYFLSLSGPGFGPTDIVSGLPFLGKTGYETFQAEIFLESALPLWTEPATKAVAYAARTNGLHCSAFVAHFLGSVFSSGSNLSQGLPLNQTKATVAIASSIISSVVPNQGINLGTNQSNKLSESRIDFGLDGRIFVVPVPAFAWLKDPEARIQHRLDSGSRFRDLIATLLSLCSNAGLQLALELLPGNILGGSADFMSLVAEPGFADLGLLLDTGHFWAMGEAVQGLPQALGSRILATHLCDNDGLVNLSLCPGDGSIPFPELIKNLGETRYSGALDLEIVCSQAAVEHEYRRALAQFKQLADQAFILPGRDHAAGHQTNQ